VSGPYLSVEALIKRGHLHLRLAYSGRETLP